MTNPPFDVSHLVAAPPVSRPLDPSLETPLVGPPDRPPTAYPAAVLPITEDQRSALINYLLLWKNSLSSSHGEKMGQYQQIEKDYRALPESPKSTPFVGACNDVVPVIAMGVDPVYSRLETGIFGQDPIFRATALKKSMKKYAKPLEEFVDFYVRNKLNLRQEAAPRILEATKLGCCVFKTIFDREEFTVKTYDEQFKVVDKTVRKFNGPRVLGISRDQFMYPPGYKSIQDCPIVAELQYPTVGTLLKLAQSGKLDKDAVEKVREFTTVNQPDLQPTREDAAQMHEDTSLKTKLELVEFWFEYAFEDGKPPAQLTATIHFPTTSILQLRYNWYFHQRYPYTLIPYTVTNASLDGVGIGEMNTPFQRMITRWQQVSFDNAYLANIRMFAIKTGAPGFEKKPKLFAGRMIEMEDPSKDIRPIQLGDIYNSTLSERQNLFGMSEKRTGISDYLTGRESPIIGTRATATSTVALIQEGTKRVEQVLQNFREGFAEIIENCIYLWIQYGVDDIDDLVFGDDDTGRLVKEFFDTMRAENVNGSMAFELSITDANTNKQAQQQIQLALIQQITAYYGKLIEAAQLAVQTQQSVPSLSKLVVDVMDASRKMYLDLLSNYNIVNPDDYLPSIDILLAGSGIPGFGPVPPGPQPGVPGAAPTAPPTNGETPPALARIIAAASRGPAVQ